MEATATSPALTWHRIAPGYYQAVTGPGDLDRYEVCRREAGGEDEGYGNGADEWFLYYPGCRGPDSVGETLRICKAWAEQYEARR